MILNEDNFLIYAARYYNNPHCYSKDIFLTDLNHIRYLKMALRRYETKGEIKHRLALNHIIVLANMFGVQPTVNMIIYRLDSNHMTIIKPFLMSLKYIRGDEIIQGVDFNRILSNKEIEAKLYE